MFVIPIMPLFMHGLLGGDIAEAAAWSGLAMGVSPLLSAATGTFWTSLGQRVGQQAMLMRSVASIGLATGVMALATLPIHLVLLRVIIGLFGGIPVAALAAITVSARRQDLGRSIAALQTAQMIGPTMGPLLGGALAAIFGFRSSFVLAAALFGLAALLVAWLYRNPPPRPEEAVRQERAVSRTSHRGLAFWIPVAALFMANFVEGSFMTLLPILIGPMGAPSEALSLIAGIGLSASGIAVILAAQSAGRLEGRAPVLKLIAFGLGVTAILLLVVASVSVWWQFIALRVLVGIASGGVPTLTYSAIAAQVPPDERAQAVSLASSVGMLGWAASPYLAGLMVGVSLPLLYAAVATLLAVCAAAVWRIHRHAPVAAAARPLTPAT